MALTLLLVRHGETVYNAENRYQGQRDIPLSETGRVQARRLGARLAALWNQGPAPSSHLSGPPLAVYASDLRRAAETAALIIEQSGLPLPVRSLFSLRERNFGAWEGLTAAEIHARFPDFQGFAASEPPAGAETWADVWARMNTALEEIWQAHAEPTTGEKTQPPPVVLVVGHGGSLRAFLCRALGVGVEQVRRFRLDNASLSIAEFWGSSLADSEGRVALLNDTAHLTDRYSSGIATDAGGTNTIRGAADQSS